MDKFALIGFPAIGSMSPKLFGAAYGGRYEYGFIEEERFEDAWRRFIEGDYRAVNVTAPHKLSAAAAATWRSPEVETIGAANILVKTDEGVKAYNSDFLGVAHLIRTRAQSARSAAVIGFGGAGKAAYHAALSCGLETKVVRHSELVSGAKADLVIFTLPKAAEGLEKIECDVLLEANYRTPACANLPSVGTYIHGLEWLRAQALLGYEIMTGVKPDAEALESLDI